MTHHSRFAASVHILAYLAYRGSKPVPSAEIAKSVATNAVVIRRLLSALVKARLVRAQKGSTGGFTLARPSQQLSLLDVYRAVEPRPDHGMSHFAPNHRCPVGAKIENILTGVFSRAQTQMEAELGRVTLAEVDRQLHAVCPRAGRSTSHPAGRAEPPPLA